MVSGGFLLRNSTCFLYLTCHVRCARMPRAHDHSYPAIAIPTFRQHDQSTAAMLPSPYRQRRSHTACVHVATRTRLQSVSCQVRQCCCGVLQLALREACGGETSAKLLHSYTGLNIVQHQEIEHKEDLIWWCFLFGRKYGLSDKRSLHSYLHIVMVQSLLDSFDK